MNRKPHWPPRWTQKGQSIYYVTRPDERARYGGKTWYRLGATEAEAFAEWYSVSDQSHTVPRTIGAAMDLYAASDRFDRLADRTKADYLKILGGKLREVFGNVAPTALYPTDVYRYLSRRPPVAGNRELAVLSNVMHVCVKAGACTHNPIIKQVQKNQEKPRERYVSDAELESFLSHCSPFLKAWVGLKRITGARQGQIRAIRLRDWDGENLTIPGAKKGRTIIYSGDGLADSIDTVLALRPAFATPWLFVTRQGKQYSADGFRSIWQRAMKKFVDAGGERFTEHDLRAKAASDAENLDVAQDLMGHQSAAMTRKVYNRKPNNVSVLPVRKVLER